MTRRFLRLAVWSGLAGCFLPVLVWCFNAKIWNMNRLGDFREGYGPDTAGLFSKLAAVALLTAAAVWGARFVLRRLEATVDTLSEDQADLVDRLPERWVDAAIAGSAALSLVLELVLIRWQGLVLPVFGLYKNFGLLACFAGLGLGYSLSRRRQLPLVLTLPLLVWQMVLFVTMQSGPEGWRLGVTATPLLEQLNMGTSVADSVPKYLAVMDLLAVSFLLTSLAFVPVGQLCGRLMDRRADKLRAYGLNLLGSLAGIVFTLGLSYLWTPPVTWFAVCFGALAAFQAFDRRPLVFASACALVGVVVLTWPTAFLWEQVYSPYQLIQRGPGPRGLSVLNAGGLYYQRINDLATNVEQYKPVVKYYEFPFRAAGRPGDVAIVGAGTGNDVAAALQAGADRVDAIEIDPAILAFGKAYHPNEPYKDPRVHAIVNDARTHLRTTDRTYDTIVYGLLDSHTLLSSASSVRLDSFVYTVEGLKESRARLKDGGLLSLSFCVMAPELGRKFYLMLEEAFGRPPVCIEARYDLSVIFLARNGAPVRLDPKVLEASGFHDVTAKYADPALKADVSTDDWPFVYMPKRVYPYSYLAVVAMMLALSLLLVGVLAPARPRRGQAPFFLLGAGFMLVETKSITELGLTFGNTWHVIGVVIAGILAMAFLGNLVVRRWEFKREGLLYLPLLASLALGWFIAGRGGFPSTLPGRLAALVVLTSPLFFSGLVFSTLLRSTADLSGAMAANLIGVIVGGILEYNSMYFGFRALYLMAMVLYGAAYLTSLKSVGSREEPVAEPALAVGH
jgi:spermidine synthase